MPIFRSQQPVVLEQAQEFSASAFTPLKHGAAASELAREIAIEDGRSSAASNDLKMAERHLDNLQASGGAAASMTNDLLTERAWLRRILGDQLWQDFESLRSQVVGTRIVEFNASEQHQLVHEHSLTETLDRSKGVAALLFSSLASDRVRRAEEFAANVCQSLAETPQFNAIADSSVRKELLGYVHRSIVQPFALFSN